MWLCPFDQNAVSRCKPKKPAISLDAQTAWLHGEVTTWKTLLWVSEVIIHTVTQLLQTTEAFPVGRKASPS